MGHCTVLILYRIMTFSWQSEIERMVFVQSPIEHVAIGGCFVCFNRASKPNWNEFCNACSIGTIYQCDKTLDFESGSYHELHMFILTGNNQEKLSK